MKRFYYLLLGIAILFSLNALAGNHWEPIRPDFDQLNQLTEDEYLSDSLNLSSFVHLVGQMRQMADGYLHPKMLSRTKYWETELMFRRKEKVGDILDSIHSMEKAGSEIRNYAHARICYLEMRTWLYLAQDYSKAYQISLQLLAYFKKMNYQDDLARLYANQGLLLYYIGNLQEALEIQIEARHSFSGLNRLCDSLKNELNVCNTLYQLGDTAKAIEGLKSMERLLPLVKNKSFYVNVLLSSFHYSRERAYAERALQMAQQLNDSILQMKTLQNIGAIYFFEGNTKKSLECIQKVYRFFQKRNDTQNLLVPTSSIASIYESRSQWDSAYYYLKQATEAKESLTSLEKMAEINRIQSRAEIESHKMNLMLAKEQATNQRRRNLLIISLLGSILIFISSLLFYQRKRALDEKKISQLESNELTMRLEHERLKNERSQLKIDSQNRELASNALVLQEKNKQLDDLLSIIQEYNNAGVLPAKEGKILEKKVQEHLNREGEWEHFQVHFEQVHPDFFQKLKNNYPALSENDLKICAYIRIGLSNKQIAQMLSVLPDSVNTSRYRIRKKMGIEHDLLEDALRSL